MLTKNRLLQALDEGRVPVGMESLSCNPNLVEIVGHAGFDFIKLDMEHTPLDWTGLENLVRAADSVSLTSVVRVAENNPTYIRRALETGTHGVMIPLVNDADGIRSALDAAYYTPTGTRGACPSVRASGYGSADWDDFLAWSRDEVTVIPMVETAAALENVAEIVAPDLVRVVTLGVGDLSQDLGYGVRGLTEPAVLRELEKLIKVADQHGVAVWCSPFPDGSEEACRRLLELGVRVVMYSGDQMLFQKAAAEAMAFLQPLTRG